MTAVMVEEMPRGSVVVDLAAERGGNCELTRPGEVTVHNGVCIVGPLNLASSLAHDASRLYSKNITTFPLALIEDGALSVATSDEIVEATLVTHQGSVPSDEIRSRLQL